jgi:toxin YoeB
MKLVFSEQAWAEYLEWQRSDPAMVKRINLLLREASRAPFEGIGKPEPLRHALQGWWSRRIDAEHRLVYKIVGDQFWIAQLRYHY